MMNQQERFESQYADQHDVPVESMAQYRMGDSYRLPGMASHYRTFKAAELSMEGLRAFANEMISAVLEGGSFDGGDIQDIAVKHGLMRIETRDESCGEACACAEYGFPAQCYRKI